MVNTATVTKQRHDLCASVEKGSTRSNYHYLPISGGQGAFIM